MSAEIEKQQRVVLHRMAVNHLRIDRLHMMPKKSVRASHGDAPGHFRSTNHEHQIDCLP